MDQTTTPTYKYWFWAGAALLVVSLFLPVYHFEFYGSSILKPLGIQVWYESITFDGMNRGVFDVLGFVLAAFNLVQLVYLAPKHDDWMIKGTLPKAFLVVAFGLMPLCIAYQLNSQLIVFSNYYPDPHFLREGAYVYLAGYIASGIGILQLRKYAKAEVIDAEVA